MRIAYLVLAHKDLPFLERVSKKLTVGTENHVFIHWDKRAPDAGLNDLMEGKQIHVLQDRIAVYWGGWNSIVATIHLFREALALSNFDRYVILQGLDYPIASNKQIDNFFEKNPKTEFIRAVCETDSNDNKDLHKYVFRYYMDKRGFFKKVRNRLNIVIKNCYKKPLRKPYVFIDGMKSKIYRGWAHFALTESAVQYVLHFYDTHPDVNAFFRHTYAPDESYFHTIIYNSQFIRQTPEGKPISNKNRSIKALLNLTYFEYPKYVKVFTKTEEYETFKDSGCLYFRKATSESKELLDYIDRRHEKECDK